MSKQMRYQIVTGARNLCCKCKDRKKTIHFTIFSPFKKRLDICEDCVIKFGLETNDGEVCETGEVSEVQEVVVEKSPDTPGKRRNLHRAHKA